MVYCVGGALCWWCIVLVVHSVSVVLHCVLVDHCVGACCVESNSLGCAKYFCPTITSCHGVTT